MKIRSASLKWYVLQWDINKKKVVNCNILSGMKEDIAKEVRREHLHDRTSLRVYLEKKFKYRYWSQTECEFFISDLHGDDYEKVDMWRQIEPNLDRIVDYVNKEMDLNFE